MYRYCLWAIALGLLGCSDPDRAVSTDHDGFRARPADGGPSRCQDTSECGAGLVCSPFGLCVPPTCAQSADCGADMLCSPSGTCIMDCRASKKCPAEHPVCDPSTGFCVDARAGDGILPVSDGGVAPCERSVECGEDMLCVSGTCVPDCRVAGCPADHPVCQQSTGICVSAPPPDAAPPPDSPVPKADTGPTKCQDTSECKAGLVCAPFGLCVPPSCQQSAQCGPGVVCGPSGMCVPDCRITQQCPPNVPTCNPSTGVCG